MDRSHCYNPFVYLRNDNDIQRLVTNLFKSTTPKGAQSSEPFWDNAAQMLLLALIFYLKYEAPEEEQNFAMVMEMLRAGDVDVNGSYAALGVGASWLAVEGAVALGIISGPIGWGALGIAVLAGLLWTGVTYATSDNAKNILNSLE